MTAASAQSSFAGISLSTSRPSRLGHWEHIQTFDYALDADVKSIEDTGIKILEGLSPGTKLCRHYQSRKVSSSLLICNGRPRSRYDLIVLLIYRFLIIRFRLQTRNQCSFFGQVEYGNGKADVACHGNHALHCTNLKAYGFPKAVKASILEAMKINPNISSPAVLQFLKGLYSLRVEAQDV